MSYFNTCYHEGINKAVMAATLVYRIFAFVLVSNHFFVCALLASCRAEWLNQRWVGLPDGLLVFSVCAGIRFWFEISVTSVRKLTELVSVYKWSFAHLHDWMVELESVLKRRTNTSRWLVALHAWAIFSQKRLQGAHRRQLVRHGERAEGCKNGVFRHTIFAALVSATDRGVQRGECV